MYSCQLPPLPPPPSPFFNPIPPPNWMPYGAPLSNYPFAFPPGLPVPPPPPPPPMMVGGGLLPRPPYNGTPSAGRGRCSGPRARSMARNGQKWKVYKCEACDRTYRTEETFAEHMQSHVKCSQCDFTALPKKVKDHSQVHALPDFLNFNSDDDVKRWREERKRNYPTLSNVARKKKSEEDRRNRGQVVDTPLYRYVNQLIGEYDSRCRGRGRGGRRGGHRGAGRWNQRNPAGGRRYEHSKLETPTSSTETTPTVGTEVTPTVGTETTPTVSAETTPTTCTETTPTVCTETTSTGSSGKLRSNESFSRQTRGRKRRQQYSPPKQRSAKQQCSWVDLPLPHKPTLLEKLLASAVRREHNVILQCVKHTVQNNFFQSPDPLKSSKCGKCDDGGTLQQ